MTDLRKREPVEVKIPVKEMVIGIFVFAVVFWIIGLTFRHYVPMV